MSALFHLLLSSCTPRVQKERQTDRQREERDRFTSLQNKTDRRTEACIPVQYGQRLVHNREQAAFCLPVVTPSHAACVSVSLCFLCQCVLLLPSVCVYVWPPQTCQSCVYIFLVSVCVSVSCRFLK